MVPGRVIPSDARRSLGVSPSVLPRALRSRPILLVRRAIDPYGDNDLYLDCRRVPAVNGAGARMKLEGRVAIVTGSSMGIGEAIAEAYAAEGARIVVNSRSLERATAVADRLAESGAEAIAVGADV